MPALSGVSLPRLLLFALCLAGLFLIVNQSAFHSFFTDDDLDNMANARLMKWTDIARVLAVPSLSGPKVFRAVGYSYYVAMVRTAGLTYWPYVAGILAIHLVNVLLLWLLARGLGAEFLGAGAAAVFYFLHAALFDVYWKPMYVVDLLCATFTLAALLAYVSGWLLPSLVFFWLGLKSKESAILLPLVILAYELFAGGRKWKRAVPFLAVAAWLGVQALLANQHRDNAYTLRFTLTALWTTASFYARWLLFVPYAGFAVLAMPFLFRKKPVWFGVFMFLGLLGPLLFLPGRLSPAYLYVPLLGLAVALSAIERPVWAALFFLLWIPWNYLQFRSEQREELAAAADRRSWVASAEGMLREHPDIDTVIYDGAPKTLGSLGMAGLLRNYYPLRPATAVWLYSPESAEALQRPHAALVVWDPDTRHATVLLHGPDVSYIRLTLEAPIWQLLRGWPGSQGTSRWIAPSALARLYRPADARVFEVVVPVSQYYLDRLEKGRLDVKMDGALLGSAALEKSELTTFHFPVPPGPAGPVEVEFIVTPPLKDPNAPGYLGQQIAAFGFLQK
jgi:hypothetical protein